MLKGGFRIGKWCLPGWKKDGMWKIKSSTFWGLEVQALLENGGRGSFAVDLVYVADSFSSSFDLSSTSLPFLGLKYMFWVGEVEVVSSINNPSVMHS